MEHRVGAALSDEEPRERFRLVGREVEVARLLAGGGARSVAPGAPPGPQ